MFFKKDKILVRAGSREIVFWGCSEDWVPKSKKMLPNVSRIIDIQNHIIGDEWMGLNVLSSSDCDIEPSKVFVVITSGSVESVTEMLIERGFSAGNDFCYSPFFEDFYAATRINDVDTEIIFTSSDYGARNTARGSRIGGGIFSGRIQQGKLNFRKIVEGAFRQACTCGDSLITVDYVKNELHIYDSSFRLTQKTKLERRHYTGVSVSDTTIFLISSADDVIEFYQRDSLSLIDTIAFSELSNSGEGKHHMNDCHYSDGKLYFSYFSRSGVWRNEVFDGGISYVDLRSNKIYDVMSGLFQPHSPCVINDSLHYCESPKGLVYSSSWNKLAELPGFVRGIDAFEDFYYFSLNESLYMKRSSTISHVMMNTGIVMLDVTSKAIKFYETLGVKSIHTVLRKPLNWPSCKFECE